MAAALRSPQSDTGARVARSVIASPLLNLAPANGTGPTIKHSRPVLGLRGSGIGGTAMLALSPDRRAIDIAVVLDPPSAVTVNLRRLDLPHARNWDQSEEALLIVEVALCGRSAMGSQTSGRFSLDHRHSYAAFDDAEEWLETGICLSEVRAGSVAGIHVEPARARHRANPGQREYFCARMLTELGAAECSRTAVAASRHVELATLYARRLQAPHFASTAPDRKIQSAASGRTLRP